MAPRKIQLTVAEAQQQDVGKSIARISSHLFSDLALKGGDAIEIVGKKIAVACVLRARAQDEGKDIIRIDGITRFNADVSVGEIVEIKKVECPTAKEVTLSPMQEVEFSGDPRGYFLQRLVDKPVMKGQQVVIDVMGTQLCYSVGKMGPGNCCKITLDTELILSDKVVGEQTLLSVRYEDIGGLHNEIEMIREMVELPMKHPEVFARLGISAPKGVLLTGPPGTGKTLIAKAVATETDSHFFSIAGPEIMSKFYGESEKQLRDIFEQAQKSVPAIIFIDEIDSIAPKRGEGHDQTEKRVVAQLLTAMDGLKSRGQVVVMAATNRPDDIDEALRRPGRFDRELKIMPPGEEGREEILQIHTRGMPLAKDVDLKKIAIKTIGFTGADLEVLCKEAALKALKPYMSSLKEYSVKVPTSVLEKLEVAMKHFIEALQIVEPTAMREVLINKPNVSWDDIGGLDDVKRQLREVIELPLLRPELFEKAGIKPPKGILLSGPPGTGKTLLAKAIASCANANFISVKGPELVSKWVGESEKKLREIFKRARLVASCVIFFDEFDSITKVRGASLSDSTERMVNQLLTEIDGIENLEKVTIIAATNRLDLIDPALIRPGRIELKVEIDLPDEKGRVEILRVHTKGMPLDREVNLESLAKRTKAFSGAELEGVCREAGMNAIRDVTVKEDRVGAKGKGEVIVTKKNFDDALETVKKRGHKKEHNESNK